MLTILIIILLVLLLTAAGASAAAGGVAPEARTARLPPVAARLDTTGRASGRHGRDVQRLTAGAEAGS